MKNSEKIDQEKKHRPPIKVGLISPIAGNDVLDAQHWQNVKRILQEAVDSINEPKFELELVSASPSTTVILNTIVQNIFDNDVVVCDASCLNPNVMFELGLRLSTKKPTILIKDYDTKFIFDTGTIEHVEYPRTLHYNSIQTFKSNVANKILSTYLDYKAETHRTFLDHFGNYSVATLEKHQIDLADFIKLQIEQVRNQLSMEINSIKTSSSGNGLLNSFINDRFPNSTISINEEKSYENDLIRHVRNQIEMKRSDSKYWQAHSFFEISEDIRKSIPTLFYTQFGTARVKEAIADQLFPFLNTRSTANTASP